MIDLHTHSTASDGNLTPRNLIRAAYSCDINVIALTDHDTIDGIPEAKDEADSFGIKLIAGVEIDINWQYKAAETPSQPEKPSREFHLLGLGIKSPSADFIQLMADCKLERTRRNLLIIEKMHEEGIDADYDELCGMAEGVCIGRPHFARYLIKLGKARSIKAAFERFLSRGKPLYIRKTGSDFARAAAAIHSSGGIATLAHPTTLYVSWGKLPCIIAELKEQGLDGIEAWHPAATLRVCRRLESLGRELGLFITAGSDFHGEKRPDRRLGYTGGGRLIDDSFLQGLPLL
ncbi:MAG: PHP domain-containing protein [Treponema sp.]|jgi:predicted metal-dependent phosphoesterase TrpH|nr:PHP domain-containing protein [Treponema sp.]